MKILMFYYYAPGTTAWYLEQAFRKLYDVKTCGPQASGMSHHDISLEGAQLNTEILIEKLYRDTRWKPDIFIMVDSGHTLYPKGVCFLSMPTLFYAIDTLTISTAGVFAKLFDFVFIAQEESFEKLKMAGVKNVSWLPLACDPQVHKRYEIPKIYDICFLGNIYKKRKSILRKLSRRFNIHTDFVDYTEMTYLYSQSKIIFNKSGWNDINMRVFEAISSGSMLLTDRLNDNGLEELFTDKEDLVLYNEEDIEDLAEYYLGHDEERQKIAESGFKKVRAFHTYNNRVEKIMQVIESNKRVSFKRASRLSENIVLKKIKFFQSRFGRWFSRASTNL